MFVRTYIISMWVYLITFWVAGKRMFNVRQISDDFYYVGGNDRRLELFENVYPIPDGVSYNSY